ncbi:MAG: ribokinase [Candidatus Aminicenantes bacterium]|nr:ribokinase [Candidatus Aminicenantes bacterium]
MKSILVIGSSNIDMIIRVPRIPRPGETVLGGKFAMAPGGKGANQAVAAARAGGSVTFVTRVGDDLFGHEAVRNFEGDGIDVRFVGVDRGAPTGVAMINVDGKGENSISVASGANARLSPADIEEAGGSLAAADIVLLQLESPLETVEAAARMAKERGVPVVLNPAPARPLGDGLLEAVSVLTPNESEAAALAGFEVLDEADAKRAAARLRARGPGLVVVTMGRRGAYALGDGFEGLMPAFRVAPIDTTAAGDVFNGALAVALAEKMSLADALRFAQAAAAISVTRPGAQPSAPTRAEIEAFL